jgi:hypothetical protein
VHRLQATDFFNVLTGPQLLEKTEALLPDHRERHYPPTVTLSMFLKQALEQTVPAKRQSMRGSHSAWPKDCNRRARVLARTAKHGNDCRSRWSRH